MKGNAYLIAGPIIVAVLAALLFYYAGQQGQVPQVGVSEEEINNLATSPELNTPADIVTEENIPNPEEEIVVDENDVTMELPSDI